MQANVDVNSQEYFGVVTVKFWEDIHSEDQLYGRYPQGESAAGKISTGIKGCREDIWEERL